MTTSITPFDKRLAENRLRVKALRRWKWILRRGGFEPLVAALALVMVAGGLHLLLNGLPSGLIGGLSNGLPNGSPPSGHHLERTPLLFPLFFAYCLLFLGICGFIGLSIRSTALLAVFSFGGLVIRTWMAALYFASNPSDLGWINFACGALVLFWIFSRVICDAAAKRAYHSSLTRRSF